MHHALDSKRIGTRTPVQVAARFQPIPRTSSRFRRPRRAVTALITNVSVSGAEIETDDLGLEPRDTARILTGDGAATVLIRRVERIARRRAQYGVQFLEVDPDLALRINQLSVGARADEIDWRWNTSR